MAIMTVECELVSFVDSSCVWLYDWVQDLSPILISICRNFEGLALMLTG